MYSLPQTIAKKVSGNPYDQLDISNQKYGNERIFCWPPENMLCP